MSGGPPTTECSRKQTRWIYGGLRHVEAGAQDDVELCDGFFLSRPNDYLLSARDYNVMSREQYDDAARASRYLIYKYVAPAFEPDELNHRAKAEQAFQNGLLAIQIVKPVSTFGFVFHGTDAGGPFFGLETIEYRPPMRAADWARMRAFDRDLLDKVPPTIRRVRNVMESESAERKNAIILLQLGLESYHPLIAGLLWVMGMEALFDSDNRNDFEKKLCECLGPTAFVFPDWNPPTSPPTHTVKDLAKPLYMLRNKLAHGADLRTAAVDRTTPVDLTKQVKLVDFLEPRPHAYLLSEAACYLLCQVLQKTM